MDKQYDAPPEVLKLFEIKQKQRAESKAYFKKLIYNPHRSAEHPLPLDPAVVKFSALRMYRHSLYTTTPKFYFKVILVLSPIAFVFMKLKSFRKEREQLYRSGLVKYEDRDNITCF